MVRTEASTAALLQELRKLEQCLHEPAVRCDELRLRQLLHPQFQEIGRSGRFYDRPAMLALLLQPDEARGAAPAFRIAAQDFQLRLLAPSLAQLVYRSAHVHATGEVHRHTLRSSLWQHDDGAWRMLFHQGTATEPYALTAPNPDS